MWTKVLIFSNIKITMNTNSRNKRHTIEDCISNALLSIMRYIHFL